MDNLDDKIGVAFAKVAGPLLERLTQLEDRVREREFEMVVYRNAYDNLIKELNDMKNKLKMVPAGELTRQVPADRGHDRRVREEADNSVLSEEKPGLLSIIGVGNQKGG
jgi:hypothetical protein